MRAKVGGVAKLDEAIEAERVEVFDVGGVEFARTTVWALRPGFSEGWVSVPEMAAHLGLTRRAIKYQIARGELEKRYQGHITEVRRINSDDEEKPRKHRVGVPDRPSGRG
tara:strand:+ start:521 stop:850 length:330 start_codon:yes stop_codon:yes gene_type:complete